MTGNCPCEHKNKVKHVDVCWQNDVWKGSRPSSLDPVDNRIRGGIGLHHQGARSSAFSLLVIVGA